jgi:hypothetical protein
MITRKKTLIAAIPIILALVQGCAAASPALSVRPKLQIMPVVSGVTQEIEVELSAPGLRDGDVCELSVTAESGLGVLLTDDSPSSSEIASYRIGEPQRIVYRWAGPSPVGFPITETIAVSAPSLGVSSRVSFDVGINLNITAIRVPDDVEAGTPAQIDIEIADSLHPDADIGSILSDLGITPEIMLSLATQTESGDLKQAADSRIIAKFFEDTRAVNDMTYPGSSFTPGRLLRYQDGSVIWESADGTRPRVSPILPGKYVVVATLRSNSGGIGLKEMVSPQFEAVGGPVFSGDAQGVAASTIGILRALGHEYSWAGGDPSGVMPQLGAAMRRFALPTPVQTLGRYVQALTSSELEIGDLAGFISPFLRGFEGYGVLIATKGGVKAWEAAASDGTLYKNAPQGRVYEDERYVVIPFELGKNFTLSLSGSGSGAVSLWKIVPEGVNFKEYEAGNWEMEITVDGGVLFPKAEE